MRTVTAATIAILYLPGSHALAQQRQLDRRLDDFRKQTRVRIDPATPADERVYVEGGAFGGFNYLSLDDSNLDNRILRQYDITGYARVNVDRVHDFFFRGRASFRNFNEGDVFGDSDNNDWETRVERAFYQFDLQRALGAYRGEESTTGLRVKGGRDLVYWGNGLTLAQTLDGVVVDVETQSLVLEFIAGVTPDETVDIDTSRPDYNTDTERAFFGGIATLKARDHRPFAYFLAQRDHNDDELILTSPALGEIASSGDPEIITTRYNYNSYYVGLGSAGPLSDQLYYSVEVAGEFGKTLSNSFSVINTDGGGRITQAEQEDDPISAFALDMALDYAPRTINQPRLSAEFVMASGDDDRGHPTNTFNGNLAGSTDRGFNAFGLLNTGLAFSPEVSNLLMLRVGGSFLPAPRVRMFQKLQVGMDLFVFGKFNPDAPITEATTDDRYLGFEPDLYLNWQISSDVTLALRYGIFFPGDAIVNDDRPRQFIFVGVTVAF